MDSDTISKSRLTITIDMKKDRIRIHRKTLHAIGDPDYIHLLVNPDERTLAVLRSDRSDPKAYRLPKIQSGDNQAFEISSKPLVKNLLNMCSEWQADCVYRIYGETIPGEGVVAFNLASAQRTCRTRR